MSTTQLYNVNDIISKVQLNKHLNDICDYPKFFDPQTTLGIYQEYCSNFGSYNGQIQLPEPINNLNGDQIFHLSALKACHQVDKVPNTYNEAMKSPDCDMWQQAMDKELASLRSHCCFLCPW